MVMPRFKMEAEARALVEAVEYCKLPVCLILTYPRVDSQTSTDNTIIYQDLIPIHELGPHPGIYLVTPTHLRIGADFPDYIRLSLICTTLSHRINRLRDGASDNALAKSFYQYRGMIIHSLREGIEVGHKHTGDLLVAGIISLLLADVSESICKASTSSLLLSHTPIQAHQGASLNWRCHLEGVHSLITLRGGVRALSGTKSLDQLLLCFILCVAGGEIMVFEQR